MSASARRARLSRLLAVYVALALLAGLLVGLAGVSSAVEAEPAATPTAVCGPGSLPETGRQGRVMPADRANGRSALGYSCNSTLVGVSGTTGGFKTLRYVDRSGRECAYYDGSPGIDGGVRVLDMKDPAKPVESARLTTPAMMSPHESLDLNQARGLLVAAMGTATIAPGFVDVYDLTQDCRKPVLRSSTPLGIAGHESGFAPDGRTFYVSAGITGTIVAVGLDDPSAPTVLWTGAGHSGHGVSISADGRRAYVAELPHSSLVPKGPARGPLIKPGLTILDVSQVQDRVAVPSVPVVTRMTWDVVSLPQNSVPLTIKGRPYLLEFDEFSDLHNDDVGAARIIELADEENPRVVSNLRLEANQSTHAAEQRTDSGADAFLGGYSAHYCAVPSRVDPGIVACTFILSGLRVFDIRDPMRPREVAYDSPEQPGNKTVRAVSAPAFSPARQEIWWTDGNSGFRAVRLTNGTWPAARR